MPIRGEFSPNLFRARVDALYRTDLNGRLESTNEWDRRLPPRFHLMRTAEGPIFRCRADVPDNIVRALSAKRRQGNLRTGGIRAGTDSIQLQRGDL